MSIDQHPQDNTICRTTQYPDGESSSVMRDGCGPLPANRHLTRSVRLHCCKASSLMERSRESFDSEGRANWGSFEELREHGGLCEVFKKGDKLVAGGALIY